MICQYGVIILTKENSNWTDDTSDHFSVLLEQKKQRQHVDYRVRQKKQRKHVDYRVRQKKPDLKS